MCVGLIVTGSAWAGRARAWAPAMGRRGAGAGVVTRAAVARATRLSDGDAQRTTACEASEYAVPLMATVAARSCARPPLVGHSC